MAKSLFQPKWRNRGISSLKRFQEIKPFIKNKKVLDVGCAVGYLRPNWLHKLISDDAKQIVGIDIDSHAIDMINSSFPTLDVRRGDARSFDVQDKFEVIHAGELIEHIDNFEGFLQSVKKHMQPDGVFILSTPNVESINHVFYNLTGGLKVNAEHVCWFCDKTLSALLVRNGFEVESIHFLNQPTYGVRILFRALVSLLPKRLSHPTLFVKAKLRS